MERNGFSREEICDELDVSNVHLRVLLSKTRAKGVDVPRRPSGTRCQPRVSIERLIHIRNQLRQRGFMGAGLYRVLAERVGMHPKTVCVRCWRYDKAIQPKRAAA